MGPTSKVCLHFALQIPSEIYLVPLLPYGGSYLMKDILLPSKDIFIMAFSPLQGYILAFIPHEGVSRN